MWLLQRGWRIERRPPGDAAAVPPGAYAYISREEVAVVQRGGEEEAYVVSGEPLPGLCALGRYAPCGQEGIQYALDLIKRYPIAVWNKLTRRDPIRDGLPWSYLCHHSQTVLIIPLAPGRRQRPVHRLPWRRACQIDVVVLHAALESAGFNAKFL